MGKGECLIPPCDLRDRGGKGRGKKRETNEDERKGKGGRDGPGENVRSRRGVER